MKIRLSRAVLAFALPLSLAACGDSSPPSHEEVPAAPTERDLPVVPLGKSAQSQNFEIKIDSVEDRSKVGVLDMGPKLSPGETFVVVRYTIKNIGRTPLDRGNQPDVKLIDGDFVEYAEDREAGMMEAIKNEDDTGTLNRNVTGKRTAVWRLEKASFDKAAWRIKVPLDTTTDAALDKISRWPLDSKAPPPLMFAIK